MPGFTHLQTAQPVTFGHHLLAYVEMLRRATAAGSPMRASGSTNGRSARRRSPARPFPIDRDMTAKALGFDRPTANSLDAVVGPRLRARDAGRRRDHLRAPVALRRGDRDLDVAAGRASCGCRDKFTTGSSIMPQKRNPDAAELVRAKIGRVIGALTSLLVVMKGLPLAYQKDMQEDKEGAMDALAALSLSLAGDDRHGARSRAGRGAHAHGRRRGLTRRRRTSPTGWCGALNMPFRDAHHITGRIVAKAASKAGVPLHELTLEKMQAIEPRITKEVFKVLSVENSVKSRVSYGGTAPKNVLAQAKAWLRRLEKQRKKG